jgi:uncharacterized protein
MGTMIIAVRIAFGLVFLAVLAGIHVYLYRRLIRDVALPKTARRARHVLLGGFAVLALVGFVSRTRSSDEFPIALAVPVWFGVVLNLLMVLLVVDGALWLYRRRKRKADATTPVSEDRRLFLSRALAASTVVAGAGITGFGAFRAYAPAQISEIPIRLPGLPKALDGFTIVQLTDVHIGPVLQTRFLDDLIDRAHSAKGDLIAITGDLVDGPTSRLGSIVSRLSRLSARHGTHFITGNHDYYSGADAWVAALRGLGIQVLRNRHVRIGEGADSFDLIGVDDWGHSGAPGDYDLDDALAGRDPSRASVLLAHQPTNFEVVAQKGIGLQLSGHTHGGQMFPGTLLGGLIWGERNTGLSRVGDSSLYVSRGCGFVGPPARNGSPPEIAKLVLVAS